MTTYTNNILKTEPTVFRLPDAYKDYLKDMLLPIRYPDDSFHSYVEQMTQVLQETSFIWKDIQRLSELSRAHNGQGPAAIKITNLPVDDNIPLPEAGANSRKKIAKAHYLSENLLTMIASMFGEPYSIHHEGKGLISNFIPNPRSEGDITGLGAKTALEWHIENTTARVASGKERAPKALLITGVKQTEAPPQTKISDIRLALSLMKPEDIVLLSQPLFKFLLPPRWRQEGQESPSYRACILEYSPDLTVNGVFYGDMIAQIDSIKAQKAVENLVEALEEVALYETVEPGSCLVIDNRVAAHARTAFQPTFDAQGRTSRWIQRLLVTETLANFDDWEASDERVFIPRF